MVNAFPKSFNVNVVACLEFEITTISQFTTTTLGLVDSARKIFIPRFGEKSRHGIASDTERKDVHADLELAVKLNLLSIRQ